MKIDASQHFQPQNITGLSSREAAFLARLAENEETIFEYQKALEYGLDSTTARTMLNRLERGGWLKRLERGLYILVPLQAGLERLWTENTLVIAANLLQPGAIAYWSALHYWGFTEQLPHTVFIQSPRRKSKHEATILGVRYQFVTVRPHAFFGVVEQAFDSHTIWLTDREKTVLDALERPDLAGGIRQIVQTLQWHWGELDWEGIDTYLQRLHAGAITKRLGYLVDNLAIPVPDREQRLARWQQLLTAGIALLEPGAGRSGRTQRRWRILDNIGVATERGPVTR